MAKNENKGENCDSLSQFYQMICQTVLAKSDEVNKCFFRGLGRKVP